MKVAGRVQVGTVWRSKISGSLAKVVDIRPSVYDGSPTVSLWYDSGDGFRPSILPSTWLLKHWDERFEELPAQQGTGGSGDE